MTFEELYKKIQKPRKELLDNGLDRFGYELRIELSMGTYLQLLQQREGFAIKLDLDTPTERINRGKVFGITFVITQDSDRVLIAKEFE